jgi:hypothetical protein
MKKTEKTKEIKEKYEWVKLADFDPMATPID